MVKLLRQIVTVGVIGGLLFLAYGHFFPNNEKQIRKMLAGMAAAASIPAKLSPVSAVMALDRIQSSFSPEVQVDIDIPGAGRHSFSGREELMQFVKGAFGTVRDIKVQFLDVNLTIGSSQESATANLTLKASQPGQSDFFFQELNMQLKKKENDWRITKVESVESLKK